MKVYVDNYKKVSSWIWDFDKEKKEFCLKINFSSLDWDEPLNLLSLASHDKQVRKEVCDNFRKIAMQYYTTDDKGNLILTCNDVWDILSKLQGEDK